MVSKRALITGITGQDGSYLAEYLCARGYEVHGIIRASSSFNKGRIKHIFKDIHQPELPLYLHYGELSNSDWIAGLLYEVNPDEVYHLGAQSHVRVSFEMPIVTGDVTGLATTRILEALHRSGIKAKFYQASSSEMFGAAPPPQGEKTPFYPRSPYAAAKVYAYWIAVNYREAYDIFACNGILFNHESPRRGISFVTRKITKVLSNIIAGQHKHLYLGNLDAYRDWGFAPEYVEVMVKMLQQEKPDDYVIGTGESHTVREFVEKAVECTGIEIEWKGEGTDEVGIVRSIDPQIAEHISIGNELIKVDPWYFRPAEVMNLRADTTKAKKIFDWSPRVTFNELVETMMDYDLAKVGYSSGKKSKQILWEKGFNWTDNIFYETDNVFEDSV